ncbi:uncharacterized protein LOC110463757 isoform X3 [Mizuhopecten yessoensis]|uniref:uncharacterized protein LOC110463757 isoform X3 n=1 Tax=Mizuhopecten yessoensis TaxID=6573 RepID=UPI000B45EA3B|nr:uncharacterized protein LOC110463757 isoform X3 [Mizuhopecten yessoensis]
MYTSMVILAVTVFSVSGLSITITGTSTLVTPTSELRIMCQPSSVVGISDVSTISVRKNTSSTYYTSIVTVTYNKASSSSVISWGNTAYQNRQGVSATGNVDSVGGARLVLTISTNNTRCEDGGAYKCNMGVILTAGGGVVVSAAKYITATVLPTYTNALYVTPSPNVNGQYYSVGTTLTFSCSGTVGSDKKIHTWCYKQAGSNTGFTDYPTAADINQNENGLVQDGCNYRRSSTLTYNVTAADTETSYMCEPFTGSLCGTSAAGLKTNFTIRNYVPLTTKPVQDSVESTGDVIPWIVVAVVFIVITIALIFAVVYLCLHVGKYKERLRERVEYQGINTVFSRREEYVYSPTDNYEIPQI